MMPLITTLGPKNLDELDIILPHEHVFVDLRTWDLPGYARAKTEDVIALMQPELEKAHKSGISAIVECSPVGVGRRADILKSVSQASRFPLVVPTGIYREPWIPEWAHRSGEDDLFAWMKSELEGQIESSGVQAGFIKLSAGDNGLTGCETKILKAAARAATACGATIGSHTIKGSVVADQLSILEAYSVPPERFIWIHALLEPDFNLNLEMARRGIWIEYDSLGSGEAGDDLILGRIQKLWDAGFGDRILLSHDRGWYDPAEPGGGTPKPFTFIPEIFIPRLQKAGFQKTDLRQMLTINPFRAFAR
ncbi:MAG: phosphotriesterase [Omnitrophica WOR_2 bacterium]